MCGIVWCYTGPLDQAEAVFAPIRQQFGPPLLDWVGPMPHPALQGMFDGLYPPGDQWYWKADFVNELSDEAIARHVEFGATLPTWKSTMHLYPIDGAAGRVAPDATAWNYRDAKWGEVIVGVSPDPADNPGDDRLDAGLLGGDAPVLGRRRLRQHDDGRATRGRTGSGPPTAPTTTGWPRSRPRTTRTNLFRVNQNIAPQGG